MLMQIFWLEPENSKPSDSTSEVYFWPCVIQRSAPVNQEHQEKHDINF